MSGFGLVVELEQVAVGLAIKHFQITTSTLLMRKKPNIEDYKQKPIHIQQKVNLLTLNLTKKLPSLTICLGSMFF